MISPDNELWQSFLADDHATVARLLEEHPELRQQLNRGASDCDMPPLAAAKSRQMVDVLIAAGASVEDVSRWWASGFGVDRVKPAAARRLLQCGAEITIHAAAGIGLIDTVREMLDERPELARAGGGDGGHPLHFCTDPEIARLLISRGADIDARDDDHLSTPAQWRIGDAPEVVRLLLEHGAASDVFMAAGLGDLDLATGLVARDGSCTAQRIGNNKGAFPGIGFQGRGGTIYQWSLGFNLSPHEVALKRGHAELYEFLLAHSTPRTQLLVAATTANRPLAEAIAADHPGIVDSLDDEDRALLPKFCWETNKDIEAVRLMLDLGFPIVAPESNHGCTALHNAAWCGDADLVRLLIQRGHPTDVRDPDHHSTAIGWAVHSCTQAKRHPEGRFPEVVELLLAAGTPFDPVDFPVGHDRVDEVIKKHLDGRASGS